MSLHFLVDGYNAIKQTRSFKNIRNLEAARVSLVKAIQSRRLLRGRNNQVTIVFDGSDEFNLNLNRQNPIKVIFSKGESADETIKRVVDNSNNPKQLVVVTNDKSIIFFTRSLGAKTMSVDEFLKSRQRNPGRRMLNQSLEKSIESAKIELTYQQRAAINQELRKIWK
jgi:predicted RNA-binding protein with PIN domain